MEPAVHALYDFEGNPGSDELSFSAGEVLIVTNKDAGQGWWEGRKGDGSVGLFPEAYVQQEENMATQNDFNVNENNASENQLIVNTDTSNQAGASAASSPNNQSIPAIRRNRNTTVKTGKTLFSTFTKTAGESFILGETKFDLQDAQQCRVQICDGIPMWENSPRIFSCTVSNPVKESKFSGFKSFIAYNIIPSVSLCLSTKEPDAVIKRTTFGSRAHTQKSVLRRYKHFDWLYEQLYRKFGVAIAVPYLPDKQITGRYEDDFIEERRSQLEAWISRMGLHPVISQSEVLQHFVTSKDDEKAWKAGKRKAEKDEVVGGSFLNTIETPDFRLDLNKAEQTLETHIKFTKNMEDACKTLVSVGHDQVKKYTGIYRKDYEKLGQIFCSLSESFALDEREVAVPLTKAMNHTGQCFQSISELYSDQPKYDWNPFLIGINEYKCVLSTFPSILENQKTALEKNKEVKRLQLENKVSVEEMEDAAARTEKISFAVQAEINHFQHYRVDDFAVYMKNFLAQQIALHKEVINRLQEAASDYSDMVDKNFADCAAE